MKSLVTDESILNLSQGSFSLLYYGPSVAVSLLLDVFSVSSFFCLKLNLDLSTPFTVPGVSFSVKAYSLISSNCSLVSLVGILMVLSMCLSTHH